MGANLLNRGKMEILASVGLPFCRSASLASFIYPSFFTRVCAVTVKQFYATAVFLVCSLVFTWTGQPRFRRETGDLSVMTSKVLAVASYSVGVGFKIKFLKLARAILNTFVFFISGKDTFS